MINHVLYVSGMDTFTVRTLAEPVTDAELAGLVNSLVGLWRDDAGRHDETISTAWPHRTGAAYCREVIADPNALILVARTGGPAGDEIVGHLVGRYRPADDFRVVPIAVLESMQVRRELRGQGLGGRLVDAFLIWADQRGCGRATVTANAGNTAAQAFYRRYGFTPMSVTFQRELTATRQ
jgi:GNAT superfamily N-acetyltransferase